MLPSSSASWNDSRMASNRSSENESHRDCFGLRTAISATRPHLWAACNEHRDGAGRILPPGGFRVKLTSALNLGICLPTLHSNRYVQTSCRERNFRET